MSPEYRGFILTRRGLEGWSYRHEQRPDIFGFSPSLPDCIAEIDEICQPPVMRFTWLMLGMMTGMVAIYGAIWWVW